MELEKILLSYSDVGEIFGVSASAVRQWVRRDTIPKSLIVKISGTVRFNKRKLLDWIENNECV